MKRPTARGQIRMKSFSLSLHIAWILVMFYLEIFALVWACREQSENVWNLVDIRAQRDLGRMEEAREMLWLALGQVQCRFNYSTINSSLQPPLLAIFGLLTSPGLIPCILSFSRWFNKLHLGHRESCTLRSWERERTPRLISRNHTQRRTQLQAWALPTRGEKAFQNT